MKNYTLLSDEELTTEVHMLEQVLEMDLEMDGSGELGAQICVGYAYYFDAIEREFSRRGITDPYGLASDTLEEMPY